MQSIPESVLKDFEEEVKDPVANSTKSDGEIDQSAKDTIDSADAQTKFSEEIKEALQK